MTSDKLEPYLSQATAFETQAIAAMIANVDDNEVEQVFRGRLGETKLPGPVRGMFRSTNKVAQVTTKKILLESPELLSDAKSIETRVINHLTFVNRNCALRVKGLNGQTAHDRLFDESQCRLMHDLYEPEWLTTKYWGEWFPCLHEDWSIRKTIESLPGISQDQIPEIIREFESPGRSTSLPGAITLERHDILHIVLQRGLLDQDEAFVIGATMGSTRNELSPIHVSRMMNVFSRAYPEPYRIPERKLQAYSIGVQMFSAMSTPRLNDFPLERLLELTPRELRRSISIDSERLARAYEEEANQIPDSMESYRITRLRSTL